MFFLIGFAGPAGVGKTTAANLLGAELGFPVMGFADPIRAAVLRLYPLWDEWHMSAGKDLKQVGVGLTPREAMQRMGDEARSWRGDIFVRLASTQVRRFQGQGAAGAIVHDVRLPGEAEWLRAAGGTVVHLCRKNIRFSSDHHTEVGVTREPEDLAITNTGTIDGLRSELLSALVALRRGAHK